MTRIAVIGLVGKTIFMEVPHFHEGDEKNAAYLKKYQPQVKCL